MKEITGCAFITGGGSGIGLGFARALAEKGAKIVAADIRDDHLEEAHAVAGREGWADRFHGLKLDVTDREGFEAALDEAERTFGNLRILANNAGVGVEGPMDDAGYADWDWGVSVNIMGVANGLVAGLPRMKAHGQEAHIVNTASLGALIPARFDRGIYAMTKAAVISASEHLRLELQDKNIGVSVLCPGPVKTNIRESGRTRPVHLREGSRFLAHETALEAREDLPEWLDPLDVGRLMVDAVLENRLYIFPHPDFLPLVRRRHEDIEAAMK